LVAVPDLGSGAERRGGSSPFVRTEKTAFPEPELEAVFEYEEVSLTERFSRLNRQSLTSQSIRVLNCNFPDN
jgi:hypothetical protein